MQPFVSIILPVRNEANYIIPCLRSIAAQDYPKDLMELLIVDGRSNDSTALKIEEFRIQNSEFRIHLIDNPARTVPHAMNLGIAAAKGDIILRFDGHAVMAPDYVSNCVKYLEQTKADNVGGPAINISNGTAIGDAILISHNSAFGLGGGAFRMGNFEGFADTVTFGCYPKETFAKYGRYDTRLTRNQDIEFNARIRKGIIKRTADSGQRDQFKVESLKLKEGPDSSDSKAGSSPQNDENELKEKNFVPLCLGGKKPEKEENDLRKSAQSADREAPGKIYLTPKIKSYYYCRNTLRGLWSQNFRNGQWVVYTKYIAPYALSLRHFIPLLFVTTILFLIIASLISLKSSTGSTGLMGSTAASLSQVFELSTFNFQLTALRLLLLVLGVYFGTMLIAVMQAGWRQYKVYKVHKAESKTQDGDAKAPGTINSEHSTLELSNFKTVLGAKASDEGFNTKYQIPNTEYRIRSLLLLPIVFMTLHFSYGLGSIWGLVSLPYWAAKQQKR
ncbi:MAG: glycosyltransferase family 2 protein [Candidatus Edwardsbacteria bacterium]|nr:glycosyltransferase family 2 protein [Candidatus Edwardsbacteria bacterium]